MKKRNNRSAAKRMHSAGTFVVVGASLSRSDLGRLLACVRDINKDRVKDGKQKLMYRYQ